MPPRPLTPVRPSPPQVKELVILDLSKKHTETAIRLREFSKLYDVVKSDRNKYVNQIQASAQALAEMKEKLKILQNEVATLAAVVVSGRDGP